MLKGISKYIGPELLAILYQMGHGDEVVLAMRISRAIRSAAGFFAPMAFPLDVCSMAYCRCLNWTPTHRRWS